MPGPILRLAAAADSANDLSVFESCEDVQEAWGGVNGNFSSESLYQDCNKHIQTDYHMKYVNGDEAGESNLSSHVDPLAPALPVTKSQRDNSQTRMVAERIKVENMELEDEVMEDNDVVESIKVPVMEASLSVDISTSLTRQKISSVQRGRTLSYADKDDVEEAPTRRPRPHSLANDSIDVGPPLHPTFAKSESPRNGKMPPSAHRAIRVVRNPSYHFAVREAVALSPYCTNTIKSEENMQSRSCDNSPARVTQPMQTVSEAPGTKDTSRRHASEGDELMLTLAPGMPRSVSFSGPVLSPAVPGRGSLSEGNSRSGSVSQLSTSQNAAPLSQDKPSPNIVRGSVISRSFRRLFSNPVRSPTSPTSEELWLDIPSESEPKSSSRLRKIGSNLSRRLSHRSTKMSTSSGTNGQLVPNGSTTPDDGRSLVEYEDLLKLFCCSGCKNFMTPPLHQCRKGHLVCNTCRFSLKQSCPQCKQRFADNTNVMMEQVCLLVKFPCKYAAQGCTEFYQPRAKVDHEHFCVYRPVHCHHAPQGCPKVLLLRDMHEHLEQCHYKTK